MLRQKLSTTPVVSQLILHNSVGFNIFIYFILKHTHQNMAISRRGNIIGPVIILKCQPNTLHYLKITVMDRQVLAPCRNNASSGAVWSGSTLFAIPSASTLW